MEKVANNDLTIDVNLLGADDTMGTALKTLVGNLNAAFHYIAAAADQVSTGSRQVSDTSIALSQGTTEQASSVEELSASMEEISAQTRINSDNANHANSLAEMAKTNAEQGNVQMQEMPGAMREIISGRSDKRRNFRGECRRQRGNEQPGTAVKRYDCAV